MERLRSDCISCLLKKVNEIPDGTPEPLRIQYMQQVLSLLADAPRTESAPFLVGEINRMKEQLFHIKNEYSEIKHHFNEVMLSYVPAIRQKLAAAEDPLLLALQYAMTGNYIDFGAMEHVDETYLDGLLADVSSVTADADTFAAFREDLKKGRRFAILTDNCGEVVMDRLLLEEIRKEFPQLEITVIVRGEPVLNDATMEDARQVGLADEFRVLGNGTGIAGTCLERISAEARDAFRAADVILSKGQGNFETLRMCGFNVYYAFLCKCDLFASQFQVPKFSGILVNDKDCQEEKK